MSKIYSIHLDKLVIDKPDSYRSIDLGLCDDFKRTTEYCKKVLIAVSRHFKTSFELKDKKISEKNGNGFYIFNLKIKDKTINFTLGFKEEPVNGLDSPAETLDVIKLFCE